MNKVIVSIRDRSWECWVASTIAEIRQGLSNVVSIEPWTGMLFVLPYMYIPVVTAKDMLFDLSVIFIGSDMHIKEIVPLLAVGEDVSPSSSCKYFLEVNVGETEDLEPGDEVSVIPLENGNGEIQPPTSSLIDQLVNTFIPLIMIVTVMKIATK